MIIKCSEISANECIYYRNVKIAATSKCLICVLGTEIVTMEREVPLRRSQMGSSECTMQLQMIDHALSCLQTVEQHLQLLHGTFIHCT